jgi:hypothetical protein
MGRNISACFVAPRALKFADWLLPVAARCYEVAWRFEFNSLQQPVWEDVSRCTETCHNGLTTGFGIDEALVVFTRR